MTSLLQVLQQTVSGGKKNWPERVARSSVTYAKKMQFFKLGDATQREISILLTKAAAPSAQLRLFLENLL